MNALFLYQPKPSVQMPATKLPATAKPPTAKSPAAKPPTATPSAPPRKQKLPSSPRPAYRDARPTEIPAELTSTAARLVFMLAVAAVVVALVSFAARHGFGLEARMLQAWAAVTSRRRQPRRRRNNDDGGGDGGKDMGVFGKSTM
ncbi:hypothetical protein T492DRAFT_845166 [Pavlovales sp. CCMP2436]|nr:hypothetical protein T492DRAFT_845166 [Pavlovales sp. CCMP2436]